MAGQSSEPLTEQVRGIWRRVLKVDDVAPNDDFFELGGHSLNAARVIAMLRRDVARDIRIHLLFDHPQFAEFVRRVSEHLESRLSGGHASSRR